MSVKVFFLMDAFSSDYSAGGPDSDTPESELTKAARSTWARLIKKVYEVDPLICPLSATQSTAR